MIEKLKNHLQTNYPFLSDKKLLIAVSGGIDSMVLTHLFHKLNYTIGIAHCNFQLRDIESDMDEKFINDYSKGANIPFFTIKFDTANFAEKNHISTQMAARKLRYDWFYSLLKKQHYDYLLTAHHLDDMLETFIINFTRGTGLDGLVGIPQINDKVVRPLLIFQREEILNFALENNILWREDQTNSTIKYHRNKIRHEIVPILKELNPSLLNSFQNTINNLKNSQEILIHHINDVKDQVLVVDLNSIKDSVILKISIEKLNRLPHPKNYLYELLKIYGFTEWNDVYNITSSQSGKMVYSKTHRLINDRDYLLLTENPIIAKNQEDCFLDYTIEEDIKAISEPIKLLFSSINSDIKSVQKVEENTILVDKDLLKFPLTLRKWEKGDYFYPFGMEGKKKVSKFFKDEKYSIPQKENTWFLCSDNQIIWVIGKRADNRFRVTGQTTHILKITVPNEKNS